jgi:hypothetical protein
MSDATILITMANAIKHSPGIVLAESTGDKEQDGVMNARIRIAMELRKRPRLAFRALMKKWNARRIMRELF